MTPINNAPARGYADWQRVENWDSGVVWSGSVTNQSATLFPPEPIDCSRWSTLGGYIHVYFGTMLAAFNWNADPAASIFVGGRQLVYSGSVGAFTQLRLSNLGPYFDGQFQQVGGVWSGSWQLFNTNRISPIELIPQGPALVDDDTGAIGAGAVYYAYPNDYYSGPVDIWLATNSGSNWLVGVQYLRSDGVWRQLSNFFLNSKTVPVGVLVPAGMWRVTAQNNSAGNDSATITVVAAFTGAT